MIDEPDTNLTNVSDSESLEQRLTSARGDMNVLGAEQLQCVINSKGALSLRQSAFDCLEIWESYPNRVEPLYAAAQILFECKDTHLALMVAEFAMTIRVRTDTTSLWPLHHESTGWNFELLYARLLVDKDRVQEAMAHYGSVLMNCDDSVRRKIADEVVIASQRLALCEVVAQ